MGRINKSLLCLYHCIVVFSLSPLGKGGIQGGLIYSEKNLRKSSDFIHYGGREKIAIDYQQGSIVWGGLTYTALRGSRKVFVK